MTEAEFREQFIREIAAQLFVAGAGGSPNEAYDDATALYLEHRRWFPASEPQGVPTPKQVPMEPKRYQLENRYQDSGWGSLDIGFDRVRDAVAEASRLSENSICYGMVRVVDTQTNTVVVTFPAGVEPV